MPTAAPFAILRTEKIKAWSNLAKSVGHALRSSKDERPHLAPDVDEPIRILMGSPDWVEDWSKIVSGMWLPLLKQGTNHTLARELFLGASPEFFEGKSKAEISEWAEANVDWLKKRFGPEKIKLIVQHNDEQSPHLSIFLVGLKSDLNRKGEMNLRGNGWTLSDGVLKLGGSKEELAKLQDEYAEAMQKFALRRGLKNSKAKHQTIGQWRKQMAKPLDSPVVIPRLEKPTAQDQKDIEAYGKRVADKAAKAIFDQMKPYHQQAKSHAGEVTRLRALVEKLEPLAEAFKRLLERLMGHSPRLDTVQGLNDAQMSVNRFLAVVVQQRPPEAPAKPPTTVLPSPRPFHKSGSRPVKNIKPR